MGPHLGHLRRNLAECQWNGFEAREPEDLQSALTFESDIVPMVRPWKQRSTVKTQASPSGIPFFQ
jgi:hypothetical protein